MRVIILPQRSSIQGRSAAVIFYREWQSGSGIVLPGESGNRVIISSERDEVSLALGRRLLQLYNFSQIQGSLGTNFIYKNFVLIFIKEIHLNFSNINSIDSLFPDLHDVVVLSRHSSGANVKSMTVHPTGNPGEAMLGGLSGKLSMSDPQMMCSTLRLLKSEAPGFGYEVTLEATHHGPLSHLPMHYAEIGVVDDKWKSDEILDTLLKSVVGAAPSRGKNYVGVGGGHYMPKVTSHVLSGEENVGHMLTKRVVPSIEILAQSVEKTPECKGFIVDRKGTNGETRRIIREICEVRNLELVII